ncbi:hypothetical protein BC834DRAFT_897807 [Gloeopeniophorella convolvens]|nr:hypothetical protein BC834DRAFT_897807 [Gloeopeniophorella convolvens]
MSRKDKHDERRARNFVDSFDALSLGDGGKSPNPSPARGQQQQQQPPRSSGGFFGGFRPTPHLPPPPAWPDAAGIPPPPMLYTMPVPQHNMSRTMQHAVAGSPLPTPPAPVRMPVPATPPRAHRPVARPSLAVITIDSDSDSEETPVPVRPQSDPPPTAAASGPRTPQPPKTKAPRTKRRAQSEPLSPTVSASGGSAVPGAAGGIVSRQCKAVTNAGRQCRKMVKMAEESVGDPFCHMHKKTMLSDNLTGFTDRKEGMTFIKYEDWIPSYLSTGVQASLRSVLQAEAAPSDVPGYIYAFEILDPADKEYVHIKVGRTTNLNRRMDQWGKQCGSKEQVLRGYWPGGMGRAGVPVKGLVHAGPKGPWCHRLEHLVHVELRDLVNHKQYLEDAYPNIDAEKEDWNENPKKAIEAKPCPDCGTKHQEIFSFKRPTKGRYKGKEWEVIVKPVIEKWGGFVEAYL